MSAAPRITPAQIAWHADGTPHAPAFGDVYHARQGGYEQARHVFLGGNGLPARWRGRRRFVVLETGFGLGTNFLATWQAWRDDPHRPRHLHYLAIEAHPARADDLARAHAGSPCPDLALALRERWPPASPDLHLIDLDPGTPGVPEGCRLHLALFLGDVGWALPQLQAEVDAFYLDGFAPSRNPAMWSAALFQRMGRLAAVEATAATWCLARVVRDGLAGAGFVVDEAPGLAPRHAMTVARHAPRFRTPAPAAWAPRAARTDGGAHPPDDPVLVIGAGLAGAACARALAREGWPVQVLEAGEGPARGTSSNRAGLFHASFAAQEGLHVRWLRAGGLHTHRRVVPAVAAGRLEGDAGGLLQLHLGMDDAQARAALALSGLPPEVVTWLDRDLARARSGLDLPGGGWWIPAGGWLAPPGWVGEMLREGRGSGLVSLRSACRVHALRRDGPRWIALGAQGEPLAVSTHVVLANAAEAARLLEGLPAPALRQVRTRGQVTQVAAQAGLRRPRVPVSGAGYAIALPDGGLLCGATRQPGDDDPALRDADHLSNLRQAAALGCLGQDDSAAWFEGTGLRPGLAIDGKVGWRMDTPDRLPLIGPPVDLEAVARLQAVGVRLDAARHLPRLHAPDHGLYLLTGLGSRGLTIASLAGELLAHWITQSPCPVPAPLRDAVDPARQWLRERDRSGRPPATGPSADDQGRRPEPTTRADDQSR